MNCWDLDLSNGLCDLDLQVKCQGDGINKGVD